MNKKDYLNSFFFNGNKNIYRWLSDRNNGGKGTGKGKNSTKDLFGAAKIPPN